MYRDVGSRIDAVADVLRQLVSETSTRDIVEHVAPYLYEEKYHEFYFLDLTAPYRQFRILCGVMAETPEPARPTPLTPLRKHRLLGSLQALPEAMDSGYQPETRFERYSDARAETQTFFVRHVSHTQYFDAVSATTIQLVERLFNVALWHPNELGRWLGFKVQHLFALLHESIRETVPGARDALLALSWAADRAQRRLDRKVYHRVDIEAPIKVDPVSDDLMITFQHRFMLTRGALAGKAHDVFDQRYASEHPMLVMDNRDMYVPTPKYLIESLLAAVMTFERETYDTAYRKEIGDLVERQTHQAFARHFGKSELFRDIFIGPKQRQKDHIINAGRTVLCVESKGVRLNEIERNTRKAYLDLRKNFTDAIFCALEQAQDAADHLRSLASGEPVQIAGENVAALVPRQDANYTYIAVTDASYGMMAMDLHSLRDDVPRPSVAMSAFELEMISDVIAWLKWHGSAFMQYLVERGELANLVMSPDEMNIAAVFMRAGTLRTVLREENGAAIVQNGSDYIGALYEAWLTKSDAPLEGFNIRDVSPEEQEVMRGRAPRSYGAPRRNPTDKCPCGSGKMFQDCHGVDLD